jgi:hypothetical protein
MTVHYSSFPLASNPSPATKNSTSTAMPAFWLAVTAVTMPIRSQPPLAMTLRLGEGRFQVRAPTQKARHEAGLCLMSD